MVAISFQEPASAHGSTQCSRRGRADSSLRNGTVWQHPSQTFLYLEAGGPQCRVGYPKKLKDIQAMLEPLSGQDDMTTTLGDSTDSQPLIGVDYLSQLQSDTQKSPTPRLSNRDGKWTWQSLWLGVTVPRHHCQHPENIQDFSSHLVTSAVGELSPS